MGQATGIEWTDATWLPLALDDLGLNDNLLLQPLKWRKPRKVAVEPVLDLFDGLYFTDEMLQSIFAVMALCPQHTFLVATEHVERMLGYMGNEDLAGELLDTITDMADRNCSPRNMADVVKKACKRTGVKDYSGKDPMTGASLWVPEINVWPLPQVWLGVSVEDQATADARIPLLLQTPAAVHFVSAEPPLAALDLSEHLRQLDWVICGGESGPGARPMHPAWARSLRDQCKAAGVPFYFKQGSSANWPDYKNFGGFPADLQVREFPHA